VHGDKAGGITLLCLNAKDGKADLETRFCFAPFPKHSFNSYASSTPTVDAERVYVVWNEAGSLPAHRPFDHQGKTRFGNGTSAPSSADACRPVRRSCAMVKVILANFQDDPKFVEGPYNPIREPAKAQSIA